MVRQPSAKKVIKKILADRELRTPVKVIETLAKLVPFAVELIRVGLSPEFWHLNWLLIMVMISYFRIFICLTTRWLLLQVLTCQES